MAKLRQVDVLLGQGKTVGESVKTIGVTETTYHRWRNEYGGLKLDKIVSPSRRREAVDPVRAVPASPSAHRQGQVHSPRRDEG